MAAVPAILTWPVERRRAATDGDKVERFLNSRSPGKKPAHPNRYFIGWNVPYAPGELSAVGYAKGKKVAASKLSTARAPAIIQLTQLPLPTAGNVALYETTVMKKSGVRVVDAKDAVTVKVEGGKCLQPITK